MIDIATPSNVNVGDIQKIATGFDGKIYLLTKDGQLFTRLNVHVETPQGNTWVKDTKLDNVKDVALSGDKVFIVLDDMKLIFKEGELLKEGGLLKGIGLLKEGGMLKESGLLKESDLLKEGEFLKEGGFLKESGLLEEGGLLEESELLKESGLLKEVGLLWLQGRLSLSSFRGR